MGLSLSLLSFSFFSQVGMQKKHSCFSYHFLESEVCKRAVPAFLKLLFSKVHFSFPHRMGKGGLVKHMLLCTERRHFFCSLLGICGSDKETQFIVHGTFLSLSLSPSPPKGRLGRVVGVARTSLKIKPGGGRGWGVGGLKSIVVVRRSFFFYQVS